MGRRQGRGDHDHEPGEHQHHGGAEGRAGRAARRRAELPEEVLPVRAAGGAEPDAEFLEGDGGLKRRRERWGFRGPWAVGMVGRREAQCVGGSGAGVDHRGAL